MLPAPAAGPHLLVADYSLHGSAAVSEGSGVMVLGSVAELLGRRRSHSTSILNPTSHLQSDSAFAINVEYFKLRA